MLTKILIEIIVQVSHDDSFFGIFFFTFFQLNWFRSITISA